MRNNFLPSLRENLNQFVDLLENINNSKILDAPLEDWNDMLEKSSKILGRLHRIYNFAQLNAFKKFLQGISYR